MVTLDRSLPQHGILYFVSASIIAPVVATARKKIHKLLVIWIQLIITNYLLSADSRLTVPLGFISIPLILLISVAVSRLVSRDKVMSIFIGGLVIALVEGGLAYAVRDWAFRFGIPFGAFYGASFANYFSDNVKNTNVFWASVTTLLLVAMLVTPDFIQYGMQINLETYKDNVGQSLMGASFTIILGLVLAPIASQLFDFIEDIMGRITNNN